jgi:hypothetical protein
MYKTDLIERYILHRKPKHTIYVRYFSILLYLLNVQVAPTENKTSTSHPLGNVFEAMMEKGQDQIPDEGFLMTKMPMYFIVTVDQILFSRTM